MKLDYVLKGKQLEAHPDKSGFLVFGSKKFKAIAEHEVAESPVMLGNIVMTEKKAEKYLGDILCSEGLRASTEATIKDRAGKVKGAIYELRALTEDFRMQAVGGMRAAIDLYECCIVSSLLSNSGTWTEISEQEIKLLDEQQNTFCRALLQLPLSTPKASLRAAFGLLGMAWRVKEAKVLLVMAIRRQEEGGLAREVLEEQLAMGFPGLGQEVTKICEELRIPDASRQEVSKEELKDAIKMNHLASLKAEMVGKIKLEAIARTDMRKEQEYVHWSVEDCRTAFRLQTRIFDCRANMPTRYKRDLICRACRTDPATGMEGHEETQEHLEVCTGYSELWLGLGPMTPLAVVRYFSRVKHKRTSW